MRCGLRSAHQGGMRVKNIYVGEWPKPPACEYERPNSVSGGEVQRFFLVRYELVSPWVGLIPISLLSNFLFVLPCFVSSHGRREFLESS